MGRSDRTAGCSEGACSHVDSYQFFHITDTTALGCIGIGAVIGHGYPLYYHFKGGRAASTLLGMYAYFIGIELLIALAVDVIVLFGFIKKEYGIWGLRF